MDGRRFDALSRALALRHSRRGLPRLLPGFALAGPFALLGWDAAEAKKRKKKHKKKQKQSPGCTPDCTGKACGDDGCGGSCGSCGPGAVCGEGVCFCAVGYRSCQGKCFPDSSACCRDADCPATSGKICPNGTCVCPPGQEVDAGGTCDVRPTCRPPGSSPCENCCSTVSCAGQTSCDTVFDGGPCTSRSDCYNISNDCVGFVCCQPEGQGCYGGALPCCTGLVCVGDVCATPR